MEIAATYNTGTSFFIGTDCTRQFVLGVRVLADCGEDGRFSGTVTAAYYDSDQDVTTVTLSLDSGCLTAKLVSVLPDTAMVAVRQATLHLLRDSLGVFQGISTPSLNLFCGTAASEMAPAGIFHRATIGTRYGRTGLVETVAMDVLRCEWAQNGTCTGWRIEGVRSNLIQYSEQANCEAWKKSNVIVSANELAAPNGRMSANKIIENIAKATSHYISSNKIYLSADGPVTFSIYIKAAERTIAQIYLIDRSGIVSGSTCIVDLAVGRVTFGPAVMIGIDNGWYRIIITKHVKDGACYSRIFLHNGTSTNYTGDGVSGFYIWGAQLEVAPFPSSYIPTTEVATIRASDIWTIPVVSTWFRASAGTIFLAACTAPGTPETGMVQVLAQYDDGTGDNRIRVARDDHGGLSCTVTTAGTDVATLELGIFADETDFRMAFSWSVSGFSAVCYRGPCITASGASLPGGLTTYRIGSDEFGMSLWGGHVLHVAYFPVALSDVDKIAITM